MATVEQELAAVQKRYGARIQLPSIFVDVHPSGRTVVPLPTLPITLQVPDSYPTQPVSANVEPNAHLPPPIVKALTLLIEQYIRTSEWKGRPMIRTLLRWLESHVDELLNEIVSIQKEAAASAQSKEVPSSAPEAASAHQTERPDSSASALEPALVSAAEAARTFSVDSDSTAAPPPQAPADQPQGPFAGQDAWTVDMHVRFEHALREFLHERQRSRTDLRTWAAIAGMINAHATSPGEEVTAPQCLARFIVLQKVVQKWHQTCVAPFRAGTPLFPSAPVIPAQRSGSSALAESQQQQQGMRDASKQQGDRTVQPSKRKQRVSQPMGAHSLGDERVPFPSHGHGRTGGAESAGEHGAPDEEEEEDTDKKNPLHVRLYKYFGQSAAAEEEEEDEEEEAEDDDEGKGDGVQQGDSSEQESEQEEEEDDEEEEEEEYDDSHIAAFKGVFLDTEHKGYQVLLDRLSLYGIGTCAASRVHVNVQCTRCALVLTADLGGATLQKDDKENSTAPSVSTHAPGGGSGGSTTSGTLKSARMDGSSWSCWCPKCSLLLSLTLRPTLLHDGAAALGYIDCQNGVVTSLAGTWLIATCLECGAPVTSPRLAPPVTWETSCHHCYGRLRLEAKGADVQNASSDNAFTAVAAHSHAKSKASAARLQGINPGKPLPDEGTCKHYRHSYRWLRFPCCDQAFACDACHDEKSDHPAEWAKRMICGHCAREQPFSNAACAACGGSMRRSTGRSKFWEGGEGQRNRSLLSRKDSRKYANSKLKTRSKKDERVGAAGASAHNKEKGKTFERYRLVMINGKQTGIVETVTTKPKQVRK